MLFLVQLAVTLTGVSDSQLMIKLNNGVMMPQMALGTWQYDNATAIDAIKLGVKAGFKHIDTAHSYNNQVGVGQAIADLLSSGMKRSDLFITTKTYPCKSFTYEACYDQAMTEVKFDLEALGLDYVDLILLHGASHIGPGSCNDITCRADAGQWAAYEDIYKANMSRAIGVSNYCQSCFDCLLNNVTVKPVLNQIQLHVGMGVDPEGLVSYCQEKDILVQAYSPLGDGKLISDATLKQIGANHNKTGPQVALKWLVEKGFGVVTKADSAEYLAQDIDMYSWNLTATEMQQLDANKEYPGSPSWACSK